MRRHASALRYKTILREVKSAAVKMSHGYSKKFGSTASASKVRRRRPTNELSRRYMCNQPDCEKRYVLFMLHIITALEALDAFYLSFFE